MSLLGIEWVGLTPDNARRLALSAVFIVAVIGASSLIRWLIGVFLGRTDHVTLQTKFWTRQAVSLAAAVLLIIGLLSIWFNEPSRLATVFGLMSAGLAFALQQVVTSIAGYFVILRGSTFTVGDRISMGGVRGDVMRLGFIQTTIMEMGQPADAGGSNSVVWVKSRQFTGRIVTVANSKIFSEPVFNYTREFPFIWDEMHIPIDYRADRQRAEAIMLEAAHKHAVNASAMAQQAKADMQERFGVEPVDLEPRVFYRITDHWLELTVRFLAAPHGIRGMKDAMSRLILEEFEKAGLEVAAPAYRVDSRSTPNRSASHDA